MTDKIERNAHNALKLSMQLRKYPKRISNGEKISEIGHFLKKNMGEKLTAAQVPDLLRRMCNDLSRPISASCRWA